MRDDLKNYTFEYKEHSVICNLTTLGKHFQGVSVCRPEDYDMESQLTGEYIAHMKALLHACSYFCNRAKGEYDSLKRLYYSASKEEQLSKLGLRLYREMKDLEEDYLDLIYLKKRYTESLKEYLKEKEKFYSSLRLRRAAE